MWGIIYAMELTVVAKLDLSADDKQRLNRTLDVFTDACNAISQAAFTERCFNPVALHHLTYREIRQRFHLHANYTVRARERVARAYKTLKARKQTVKLLTFKAQSLDLDKDLFRLFWKNDEVWVSIAACGGKRIKCAVKVGQRYLPILRASKPTFAVLKRHRDGELYLHIAVSIPVPEPNDSPQNIVGVDLGEIDLLVASNGIRISGAESIERRKRFRARRRILQRKFQSLMGRLKTIDELDKAPERVEFQSLIGRLKTGARQLDASQYARMRFNPS